MKPHIHKTWIGMRKIANAESTANLMRKRREADADPEPDVEPDDLIPDHERDDYAEERAEVYFIYGDDTWRTP